MFFARPAVGASSYVHPTITSTQSTFRVPTTSTTTWTLRLWSHGTVEGSAAARTGLLLVRVPHTSDCAFQADVTETPVGGRPFFYSGARATMAQCGPKPSVQTIAGHIYLCTPTGSPTTTEVAGGTLAATGPQALASQANPLPATPVASGSYTLTAVAPTGDLFVSCGGTASIDPGGVTASESLPLAPGAALVALFYASTPPTSASGGSTGATPIAGATASAGRPTGPTGSLRATTDADHSAPVAATPASGAQLAFTGMNPVPPLLLGLALMGFGTLLIALAKPRRSLRRRTVPVDPPPMARTAYRPTRTAR